MTKKNLFRALIILALLTIPAAAFAAVTLTRFEVAPAGNRISIEWTTATEIDNSGFFVRRNTVGGTDWNQYTRIELVDASTGTVYTPPFLVLARGDSLLGADYAFYDENVVEAVEYFYVLEAINSNNQSQFEGPISTGIGLPSPTLSPTPTTSPTSTPTGSTTPGSSNTPGSATPSRTATVSITPAPSRTQFFPTATRGLASQTATPSETATLTPEPSVTNTTISSVDATLTAVLAQVTPVDTLTPLPTVTSSPTRTSTAAPTATVEPVRPTGVDPGLVLRVLLTCAIFGISIMILAGAVIFFIRQQGS